MMLSNEEPKARAVNNKADIDFSSVIPIGNLDPETLSRISDTCLSAGEYLKNQKWCTRIVESFLGIDEGEILGVFLFRIVPSDEKIEEYLWVVVGDLPPLYLVTEAAATPAAALLRYIEVMTLWAEAAIAGTECSGLPPVEADFSRENGVALQTRLKILREYLADEYSIFHVPCKAPDEMLSYSRKKGIESAD